MGVDLYAAVRRRQRCAGSLLCSRKGDKSHKFKTLMESLFSFSFRGSGFWHMILSAG